MFENDLQVQALINKSTQPTLDEIVTLARERGITDPMPFWIFFDRIIAAHKDKKSYEGSWI